MKELKLNELLKFKKLPFNVYNERGQIILYTGDLLTPEKVRELKKADVLIYDENYVKKTKRERENPLVMKRKMSKQKKFINDLMEKGEDYLSENEKIFSNISAFSNFNSAKDLRIDGKSIFSSDIQSSIKDLYSSILNDLKEKDYDKVRTNCLDLTEIISKELTEKLQKIKYLSQLKLLGDFKTCHSLNVAICAGFISIKVPELNVELNDAILSGLLHDIGKTRIDQNIAYKKSLYVLEQAEYEKHVVIGYKIIKELLKFGNKIAVPALEHHVLLDGSGYPKGINLDNITELSKVIALINYYDNITNNRTINVIKYNYEAGRLLLNNGTRQYSSELIHEISNKYILNDRSELSEIID